MLDKNEKGYILDHFKWPVFIQNTSTDGFKNNIAYYSNSTIFFTNYD